MRLAPVFRRVMDWITNKIPDIAGSSILIFGGYSMRLAPVFRRVIDNKQNYGHSRLQAGFPEKSFYQQFTRLKPGAILIKPIVL
jgi:hypothetical protein